MNSAEVAGRKVGVMNGQFSWFGSDLSWRETEGSPDNARLLATTEAWLYTRWVVY